jgi:phytoene desaturase
VTTSVVIVGAGLGGLASSALLAKAGLDVTVVEKNSWVGGKSRRIHVEGQRIDTGPSLVTFPGVLERFFDRYDSLGSGTPAREIANLNLERLPEVGRYFYRGDVTDLPVAEGHPWRDAWQAFQSEHAPLGAAITDLLTTDPLALSVMTSASTLVRSYGKNLSTRAYLDAQKDMPPGLRDIIAIHTLNAGVAPDQTLAIFATMSAVMADEGVFVPTGGVYEIALALHRLAEAAGARFLLDHQVTEVGKQYVVANGEKITADAVVSALDAGVLERLMGQRSPDPKNLSCSGVAVFTTLHENLPENTVTHSVVLPDDPDDLFDSVLSRRFPKQTMSFVNYYKTGHIYPNNKPTAAFLLAAPATGQSATVDDPWVQAELQRSVDMMGIDAKWSDLVSDYQVLHPEYFASFGASGGALYGAGRPWWRSGPFHTPGYRSMSKRWLWRVGASVHPGGGIPAVVGGALIATARMLKAYQ